MMLGLFTVSAKAADIYGPYSVTDNMEKVCSFAAAKIETRTMNFCSVDFETLEKTKTTVENATVITIQPGSTATVKDMQGAESYMALYAYNNTDDGYELLTGTVQELIGTDTLDGMFGEDAGWDVPVD